jgi:hypothetical protein
MTGCGSGLSDNIKEAVNTLDKRFESAQNQIQNQKDKYAKAKSSPDFSALSGYADSEGWEASFQKADETLARAKALYEKELTPLIKKDDPDSGPQVMTQVKRISKVIHQAKDEAGRPLARMERIHTAISHPRSIFTAGDEAGKEILTKVNQLESGPLAQALVKFPDSKALITDRFAPFAKMKDASQSRLGVLNEEYKTHTGNGKANYAAFVTAADSLVLDRDELKKSAPELEKDISQLYQSYTKVLQDMKEEYYLTIKRESWDDGSDYYNPGFASFTRKVTPATYTALTEFSGESIGDIQPSYGRISFKNNVGGAWEALDINPTENWPDRQHNAANFWVENTRVDYFHKYLKENNGETKETDWVKVNPSFYQQNLENLGMAILSKPYGVFEPDPQAAPPGMAYVGNPEYGEWKKDDNGESFWSWYGRYAFFSSLFFFPPSYYHYGSWNRWNTGYRYKKPYYGKTKSGQTAYGTRGTKIKRSPRYQNTTFAKTGGLKSRPASVRSGGSAIRGGGPKGKGK